MWTWLNYVRYVLQEVGEKEMIENVERDRKRGENLFLRGKA